ncbi:hypothetical protein GCM10020331_096340 [Ectobacillus funiculus]
MVRIVDFLTGLTGKTHQALEDIAIFRSLANMVVLAPADGVETKKNDGVCK